MPKGGWPDKSALLGGSWVAMNGVISKVAVAITHIRGLIAIITTHEPPSKGVLGRSGALYRDLLNFL